MTEQIKRNSFCCRPSTKVPEYKSSEGKINEVPEYESSDEKIIREYCILRRVKNQPIFTKVDKKTWIQLYYPVISYGKSVVKYQYYSRMQAKYELNNILAGKECLNSSGWNRDKRSDNYESQALITDISSLFTGLRSIGSVLSSIGNSPHSVAAVKSTIGVTECIVKNLKLDIMLDFICFILSGISCASSFSVEGVVLLCINTYKVFIQGERLHTEYKEYVSQSLSTLLLTASMLAMPAKLFEALRRISMLTTSKILDDVSVFHNFFSSFIHYVGLLIDLLPVGEIIRQKLHSFIDLLPIGDHHRFLDECRKHLLNWKRNPSFLMETVVRGEIKELEQHIKNCDALLEWERRSPSVKNTLEDFKRLCKGLLAYEKASRVEPSCFVFQGKPGTMKSYYVSMITQAMKESKYVHTVKALTDGKDFWDMYNNETVVIMDDLGQQGISQWRSIINIVSPLKYPLDCAKAELKDTKYFCSNKVYVTTNDFVRLNGITKNDCISDLRALWRRGYVFDFRVNREGNLLEGNIVFMYFDITKNCFVEEFPAFMNGKISCDSVLEIKLDTPRVDIIKWFITIIRAFDKEKELQSMTNELTPTEMEQLEEWYDAQVLQRVPDIEHVLTEDDNVTLFEPFIEDEEPEELDITVFDWNFSMLPSRRYVPPKYSFKDELIFLKEYCKDIGSYLFTMASTAVKQAVVDVVAMLNSKSGWLLFFDSIMLGAMCALVYALFKKIFNKCVSQGRTNAFVSVAEQYKHENVSTTIDAVKKQVLPIDIHYGQNHVSNFGLVSGHCVVLPWHTVREQEGYLTIYKDREKDHRLFDHVKYKVIYEKFEEDVVIVTIDRAMMTPFKSMSKFFIRDGVAKNSWLVNHQGQIPLSSVILSSDNMKPIIYTTNITGYKAFNNKLTPDVMQTYTIEEGGMCGTMLMDSELGIYGMHVAALPGVRGVSVKWSSPVRAAISEILLADAQNLLDLNISDKVIPAFSGIKFTESYFHNVPSKSSFVPSPLYGVMDVLKEPANLQHDGFFTVKTISKKSFTPVKGADIEELAFGTQVLDIIIDDFGDLTDKEIICGTSLLAGVNKQSSNGHGCKKMKTDYMDFESGNFTDEFVDELNALEKGLREGNINVDRILNIETLKDELRPLRKHGEPRSFRVGTLHTQVLTKKYTGAMVEHIIKNRKFNQIMIGMNPFKEWDSIYAKLQTRKGLWSGDISKWDGNMNPQVQQCVIEVMCKKYKGEYPEALRALLFNIPMGLVAVQDDLYMTTHSMPSGNFLTAIFNSLVNKFYTAMWYKRYFKEATAVNFFINVDDYVYGDDKLNGVKDKNDLNAITMRDFFLSLGMGFTTASKEQISEPYEPVENLSFLKRVFRFHPLLSKVMCPLDMETLQSTISWIDSSKEGETVMSDKLHAFQRELFLHHPNHPLFKLIHEECNRRNVDYTALPTSYLISLFTANVDCFDNMYGSF